ncbi:hypothetical protein CDD83_9404 [Cordyceps sp. RAO-2017]|nr:hypothetical protein CDD83_9404 [Cordyceps sp. RAO-2017]
MGAFSATASYLAFSGLYFVCFALAVTVCGLYGRDLNRARLEHKYADSKWVYAVVVGGLSALTSLVYLIPLVFRRAGVAAVGWNFLLFVLWIAVFGLFGAMYIRERDEGDSDIKRMKSAVWVDLVNALLWLISSLAALGYWWKHRDTRSQFTGRAHV